MNKIQAEITIHLENVIEAKDDMPEVIREYRYVMPVGAPYDECIAFAKEMVIQVEKLKERSEALDKEKNKKFNEELEGECLE